jgi:hypothetical protein
MLVSGSLEIRRFIPGLAGAYEDEKEPPVEGNSTLTSLLSDVLVNVLLAALAAVGYMAGPAGLNGIGRIEYESGPKSWLSKLEPVSGGAEAVDLVRG